ncbi:winged helix-turn-helix transcriptional regulator [Methanococcoides sp. SA1]|nr:winged helix-turn-helix transcriptional regulator [Methanococcoides sp. SA1]
METTNTDQKKQKLIEQMKMSGKNRNPSEDHAVGLKTLQNPIRRKVIEYLASGPKDIDQIKAEYNLNDMQAKLNLDMLEDAFYISKNEDENKNEYELTIRGEAYLENVKTGGKQ